MIWGRRYERFAEIGGIFSRCRIRILHLHHTIFLCFLMQYTVLRGYIGDIICYRLNTSARKKRRKNPSFKEWFLYTRYRDVVPKFFLIWYFVRIGVYIAATLVMVIFWITGIEKEYIRKMLGIFVTVYGVEVIAMQPFLAFGGFKTGIR